ncbi:MAG TPA: alpha/beta hydrolase [Actinomycetota bacterium]|nr:alpha/beta hydrolase [Actinomycetota bacterium]
MTKLQSFDDVTIAFETEGEGVPVLLLHGFATDSFINWVRPGIVPALVRRNYRVITIDQRGHGSSGKPHDPAAYADDAMIRDARVLLDHLGVERCLAAGYSMGARNLLGLLKSDDRVRAAVLGGIGSNMLHAREWGSAVADAMLATDKSTITDKIAKSFRDFAELTGADRKALAAIQGNSREPLSGLSDIRVPCLVLCGDTDPMVGSPQELADAIPGASAKIVGGTHLNVVNNPEFHAALADFLDEHRSAAE